MAKTNAITKKTETNPRRRRRRRRNPKKNIKGTTVALIAIGVFIGVPVLLVGGLALTARHMWKSVKNRPEMLPLSGSSNGYSWNIFTTPVPGGYDWAVVMSPNSTPVAQGTSPSIDAAKSAVFDVLKSNGALL